MGSVTGEAHQERREQSTSTKQTPEPGEGSTAKPEPSTPIRTANSRPDGGEVSSAQHINGIPIIDLEAYTREMGARVPGNGAGNIDATEPRNSPHLQPDEDAPNSAGGRPQQYRSIFGPQLSTPPRSTQQSSNNALQPSPLRAARRTRRDRRDTRDTLATDVNISEHNTRRPHTDPSRRNLFPTAAQDRPGLPPTSRVHCRLNEMAATSGDRQASPPPHRRGGGRAADMSVPVSAGNEAAIAGSAPSRSFPPPPILQSQLSRIQPLPQPAAIELSRTFHREARSWLIPGANDPEPNINPPTNALGRHAPMMQASRSDIAVKRGRSPEPTSERPAPAQQPARKKRSTLKDGYVNDAERNAPGDAQSQAGTQRQRAYIPAPDAHGPSTQVGAPRPRNTFARELPNPNGGPPVIPRIINQQQINNRPLPATHRSTVFPDTPGRNPPRRSQPDSVPQPPPTYSEPTYLNARRIERPMLPSNNLRPLLPPEALGSLRVDQQLGTMPQAPREARPSDVGGPRGDFGPPPPGPPNNGNPRSEEGLVASFAWHLFLKGVREQRTLIDIDGQLYNVHQQPLHQDDARRIVRTVWMESILYIINNRCSIGMVGDIVTQAARLMDTPPATFVSLDGGRLEVHAPRPCGRLGIEPQALGVVIYNGNALQEYPQSPGHYPPHHVSRNRAPHNSNWGDDPHNLLHQQLPNHLVPRANEGYTTARILPLNPLPYQNFPSGQRSQQPNDNHVPDIFPRRPPPPVPVRPTYIGDGQAQQVALDRLTAMTLESLGARDIDRNQHRTQAEQGAWEAAEAAIAYHTALKKELGALIEAKQFEAAQLFIHNVPDLVQILYASNDDSFLNLLRQHNLLVRGAAPPYLQQGPAANRNPNHQPVGQVAAGNIAPANLALERQHQNLRDGNIAPQGELNNRRPANDGDEAPAPRPFEDRYNPNRRERNGERSLPYPFGDIHRY